MDACVWLLDRCRLPSGRPHVRATGSVAAARYSSLRIRAVAGRIAGLDLHKPSEGPPPAFRTSVRAPTYLFGKIVPTLTPGGPQT